MRFQIERHSSGGLPLISEIPEFGVVRLEGYNGVGKSLTVRLLQICAASPFPFDVESQAWRSFCTGLGRLTVTVTGLREAHELRLDIDGEAMFEASQATGSQTLDWFEAAEMDGQPLRSLDELRALLSVRRISGDVGLIETLAEMADEQARLIEAQVEPGLGHDKLGQAEALLSDLSEQLGSYSSQLMGERQAAASKAQQERETGEQALRTAVTRLEQLDELSAMVARLQTIDVEGQQLDDQLTRLEAEIAEVRSQLKEATERLSDAEKASVNTQELLRQMESAERSYKNAAGRVRNLTLELAEVLQAAGADDVNQLERRRVELQGRLEQGRQRRVELDASDAMGKLIDQLQPLIDAAIAAGLGEQPLLAAAEGPLKQWTVVRLGEALTRRRDELRQVPNLREAVQLDKQIADMEAALRGLAKVEPLLEQRSKWQKKIDDALKLSSELDEQLDAAAAEKLEQLRDERRRLDEQLAQLAGERAILSHRRDALGAPQEREALAKSLAQKLDEEGLSEQELPTELTAASRAADNERQALGHLSEILRSAAAAAERDKAELAAIVRALESDNRYAWIKRLKVALPRAEQAPEEQLAALDQLKAGLELANARFDSFRTLFAGVRSGLRSGLSATLRGLEPTANFRLPELQRWLESEAKSWFSDSAVAKALLGDGATDISVDLTTKQIAWKSASGEARNKPLEALSSGEQAFAFTQARLALLSQETRRVANRLIALDEFGAFVSVNRMQELAGYLQHWRHSHTGDQILLILPTSQDYAALANATTGQQAERYRRMAQALADDEYLVEQFQVD
jgi:hypothetical protein